MSRLQLWLMGVVLAGCLAAAPVVADDGGQPSAPPATGSIEPEYFELLKLFADALDQIERNYVQDLSRRELLEAAIDGMLSKLDQYSDFIPPDELERFRRGMESEFGGIGIQVSQNDEGQIEITSPLVGSPAYRAGLLAGDRIVEIDGHSTEGLTLNDAVRHMQGPIGSEVTLTVIHPDRQRETVTLKRENIRVHTVLGFERGSNDRWVYYCDQDSQIGYIRLTAFSRHTADELRSALAELQEQGLSGLLLDLRFNPGGLLSSAIEVSDLFVPEGRIVSTAGRNVAERVWTATADGTFNGFPIVVLVNRYSASASEIVAACLQDSGRAVVVGERTWGKGSVQNVVELEAGRSALKLTTAGYKRPNGTNIHRFDDAGEDDDWGVRPDEGYEVRLSTREMRQLYGLFRQRDLVGVPLDEETAEFQDEQLVKALDHLRSHLELPAEEDDEQADPDAAVAEAARS